MMRHRQEAAFALALLALSTVYYIGALRLPVRVSRGDPLGAAALPQALAMLAVVGAGLLLLRSIRASGLQQTSDRHLGSGTNEKDDRQRPGRHGPLKFWLLVLAYVVALPHLGYFLSTCAFLVLAFHMVTSQRLKTSLVLATSMALGLLVLFRNLLGVQLPVLRLPWG